MHSWKNPTFSAVLIKYYFCCSVDISTTVFSHTWVLLYGVTQYPSNHYCKKRHDTVVVTDNKCFITLVSTNEVYRISLISSHPWINPARDRSPELREINPQIAPTQLRSHTHCWQRGWLGRLRLLVLPVCTHALYRTVRTYFCHMKTSVMCILMAHAGRGWS